MKRFFEEDMSMDELKRVIKKFQKKESCNKLIFVFFGVLAVVAAAAVVAMKVKKVGIFADNCCCEDDDCDCEEFCEDCCDDEDCDCDENGCNFTSEEDFEK